MTDREELRKLAEAATPGPWWADTGATIGDDSDEATHVWYRASRNDLYLTIGKVLDNDLDQTTFEDAEFIAAANPTAVLGLLDQLDAAEAKLAAVREIHSSAWWYDEFCDDPSCEQEHVEIDVGDLYHAHPSWLVCECCSGGDLSETHEPVQWPCPTIRALDGEATA